VLRKTEINGILEIAFIANYNKPTNVLSRKNERKKERNRIKSQRRDTAFFLIYTQNNKRILSFKKCTLLNMIISCPHVFRVVVNTNDNNNNIDDENKVIYVNLTFKKKVNFISTNFFFRDVVHVVV
jgi:hypothetical protein